METINPTSIKLPLAGSKLPASIFLCSVPVDGEHSVTLEVKDSSDINSDASQLAPSKNNSFEIDFQNSNLFGESRLSLPTSTIQSLKFNSNGDLTSISGSESPFNSQDSNKDGENSNASSNISTKESKTAKPINQSLSTVTGTTNKQNSYIKNCLIRSSSCSNNNPNVTSLAQIMSNSSTSTAVILNTNSNCSSASNFSSSSANTNDSSSTRKENSERESLPKPFLNCKTPATTKKGRAKLLSPLRQGPQQCQVCNKVFGNASALAKHKLTHSDERKYICGMCSKAFKRQDHLNGHMMTHRNKKPYECKIEGCGKSYCDARSLRRHTENHHGLGGSGRVNSNNNNGYRTYLKTIVDASALKAATEGDLKDIQLPIKIGVTVLSPTNSSSSTCGASSMSTSDSSPKNCLPDLGFEDEVLNVQPIDMPDLQPNKKIPIENKPIAGTNIKLVNDQQPPPLPIQAERKNGLMNKMAGNNGSQLAFGANIAAEIQPTNVTNVSKENISAKQFSISPRLLNLMKIEQKPVECNLCHRKFKNVPALNGHMRLHGGYFKKDSDGKKNDKKDGSSQPLQTASLGVRALIEEKIINKRCKEQSKNAFIIPTAPLSLNNASLSHFGSALPPAVTLLENKKKNESKHQFLLPQDFELFNNKISNEGKESTLVELLKRGSGSLMQKSSFQEENNNMNLSLSNHMSDLNFSTLNALQLNGLNSQRKAIQCDLQGQSTAIISLSDGTSFPLSLSQNYNGLNGDYFTISYGNDSSQAFEDSAVYKISNPEMLIADVDNLQLLNEPSSALPIKIEHSETFFQSNSDRSKLNLLKNEYLNTSSSQSSMPMDVFNNFGSDELLLANHEDMHSMDMMEAKKLLQITDIKSEKEGSLISPIPSILEYPTPPSSHENLTHSSPFDCSNQHNDSNNYFKFGSDFLLDSAQDFFKISSENELSDKEKILKLKNELEESSFEVSIKVEDLLNTPANEGECDLRDFSNSNLPFLDLGEQEFLANSQEITASFPESLFETPEPHERSQSLKEGQENNENKPDAVINNLMSSNFITEIGLQSQMMPNSDDPLLSSSPKEFGQQRQFASTSQIIVNQMENLQPPLVEVKQSVSSPDNSRRPDMLTSSEIENHNSGNRMQHSVASQVSFISEEENAANGLNLDHAIRGDANEDLAQNQESSFNSTNFLNNNNNNKDEGVFLPPPPCIKKEISNQDISYQTSSILKRRLRLNENNETTVASQGNFKCFPSVQYSSKLRKPSRTHYTPPPMLNPERKGHGLYCNLKKKPPSTLLGFDSLLVEDDHPGLVEFSDDSKVNLGSAYQAQIPPFREDREKRNERTIGEELMWDPSMLGDPRAVDRYVDLSRSAALPVGSHSEEFALKTLLKCQGSTSKAVLLLLQTRSSAVHMQWIASEVELFLKGLEKYGKNFTRIAKDIKTKSSGDCNQMYYFWKKLCLDYKNIYLKSNIKIEPPPATEVKPFPCDVLDCFANF